MGASNEVERFRFIRHIFFFLLAANPKLLISLTCNEAILILRVNDGETFIYKGRKYKIELIVDAIKESRIPFEFIENYNIRPYVEHSIVVISVSERGSNEVINVRREILNSLNSNDNRRPAIGLRFKSGVIILLDGNHRAYRAANEGDGLINVFIVNEDDYNKID